MAPSAPQFTFTIPRKMLFNNKTPLKQNLYMLATVFTLEAEKKLTPKLRAHLAERNFVQSTYDQRPADSLAALADPVPGEDDGDETHDQPSAPGDSERLAVSVGNGSGRTRPVTRASYKAALLAKQADEPSDEATVQEATSSEATADKKAKAAAKTALSTAVKNSDNETTATHGAGAATATEPGAASRKRKAAPPAADKSQAEAGPSKKRPRLK